VSFTPIKRAKASDQVAGTIRDAIVSGDYAPGDPLPGERALAGQFGVNRSTIREALHRVEAWGLVEIRHGAGARVADFLATAGLQLLPFLLAPGGRLDPKWLIDLLELRVELLGFTAAQAARHADDAGISSLTATVDALDAATTVKELQERDYEFFDGLIAMSNNRVLALLSNAIRRVYLEHSTLFEAMYAAGVDTTPHRATLKALQVHDQDAARKAMTAYGQSILGSQQ
jgi:GntR family transcriptional repressor for pyruvate dehydrogenase complex